MNLLKIFCAALFSFACLFVLLANAQTKQPSNKSKAVAAKEVFAKNCARCHGADGQARTDFGRENDLPSFADADWQRETSDKHISNKIVKGGGGMPAFGKKLSQTEIKSLVRYVRSLR